MLTLDQKHLFTIFANIEHFLRSLIFVAECAFDDLLDGANLNSIDIGDGKDSIVAIKQAVQSFAKAREAFECGDMVAELKEIIKRVNATFDPVSETARGTIAKGVNIDLLNLFIVGCRRLALKNCKNLSTDSSEMIIGAHGACRGLKFNFAPLGNEVGEEVRAIPIVKLKPSPELLSLLVCYCFILAEDLKPEFIADRRGNLVSVELELA